MGSSLGKSSARLDGVTRHDYAARPLMYDTVLKLRRYWQPLYLTLLIAPALEGCGALRAAGARHQYIEQQTQSHVYDKPLGQVWPEARQLLFAEGYQVRDTDGSSAETDWKTAGKSRTRYLLSGFDLDGKRSRIEFTRAEEQKSGKQWEPLDTDRDLRLEFELIKKVDPDRAKRIEQEADVEGDKARG
jgi:hypothetical protein